MIGIVVSREDPASTNIRDRLLEEHGWEERESDRWEAEYVGKEEEFVIVEKDGLHLYYDGIDAEISEVYDIDLVVFASRHSGDTGPLLTTHFTGNFGEAKYGGNERSLATPAPGPAKHLLKYFDKNAPESFNTSLEATHHGPSEIDTPSLYAEIGSGSDEWEVEEAGRVVAQGILSLKNGVEEPKNTVVGIGSGHYCPRFTRVELETDVAFGHIVPEYSLKDLDDSILEEAWNLSDGDYLMVNDEGEKIDNEGYEVISESTVRRRNGVSDQNARRIEDLLSSERLFLTERAKKDSVEPELFDGTELAKEARKIDESKFEKVLDQRCLGYSEDLDSTLVDIVVDSGEKDTFVEDLVDILREKYDEVKREGEMIVSKRSVFSPEKAREKGVEEGPAFGRLSNGESVKVSGRKVKPEEVHEEETVEFEVNT